MVEVLIIDDEQAICDGCKLILTEKSYSVVSSMNGSQGLTELQNNTYDLVLLDMKLPDMDGMDILSTIQSKYSGTHVIVMTGYSSVKNAVDAMRLGAFDYLAKPFSDDELIISVERAIKNKQLVEENQNLRKQLYDRYNFSNIIGESPEILQIFEKLKKISPTESTVLLEGESGTGKELFARAIHAHSSRSSKQFVTVDCSTFSPSLLESELFGHVRGAFTGAVKDKPGIFEIADGGTLFLDEMSNLTLQVQGKLLRVMETLYYKPVGASYEKKTDTRIIVATNKKLKSMVSDGTFREDLYYRLNVFPISLPSLRERRNDIPKLAYHFLRMFCKETGNQVKGFTDDALEMMVNYDWPGNIRQLKNVIERLVIMADNTMLDVAYIAEQLQMKHSKNENIIPNTLSELREIKNYLLTKRYGEIAAAFLRKALKKCDGNVTQASKCVGMKRPNFHALMKKYHISPKSLNE